MTNIAKSTLDLYLSVAQGLPPATVELLPGAGSNRRYFRLTDVQGHSLIACEGNNREENHAFVYLARHFTECGLPMPRVLAQSTDEMTYIQEDVGQFSLFDILRPGRERGGQYDEHEVDLLRRTIGLLPRIQLLGAESLDWQQCYPAPALDKEGVMFDLNYFKYCFLKTCGAEFNERLLEQDFRLLCSDVVDCDEPDAFLYRDFQARNVMIDGYGQPRFIDFQGGRRGSVCYDVASFLWQASARYSEALRRQLIDHYYQSLQQVARQVPQWHAWCQTHTRQEFDQRLLLFVFFRTLQVLGAYGFRGRFERKQHFLNSIPPALDNLRRLLTQGACARYPYLQQLLLSITQQAPTVQVASQGGDKAPASLANPSCETPSLTVRVFSFSFKRGIPEDESGNGGGYVFDCRSTHNPGRYVEYKHLTGLDQPVIRFLEADGEITAFLESVYRLADHHVERYLERGFTHLMFCFGCTGGQHRSVYSAQHLAEHLHAKYNIRVELFHREQNIFTTLDREVKDAKPR